MKHPFTCAYCGAPGIARFRVTQRYCSRACCCLARMRGTRQSPLDTFLALVSPEPNTGCWLWTGPASGDGDYGAFYFEGSRRSAHRASWEMLRGAIPDGLWVLHRCDNPPCVNPDHLFLGTHRDNMADRDAKGRGSNGNVGKTHCPVGHPYDDANTVLETSAAGNPARKCRQCANLRVRRWRAARKAARRGATP